MKKKKVTGYGVMINVDGIVLLSPTKKGLVDRGYEKSRISKVEVRWILK